VKAVVVGAATAVEGADVRAEGGVVIGVVIGVVVAEDAIRCSLTLVPKLL
jgi:hypothetical protein